MHLHVNDCSHVKSPWIGLNVQSFETTRNGAILYGVSAPDRQSRFASPEVASCEAILDQCKSEGRVERIFLSHDWKVSG